MLLSSNKTGYLGFTWKNGRRNEERKSIIIIIIITSAEEVMLSPVLVCLYVSRITQKLLN